MAEAATVEKPPDPPPVEETGGLDVSGGPTPRTDTTIGPAAAPAKPPEPSLQRQILEKQLEAEKLRVQQQQDEQKRREESQRREDALLEKQAEINRQSSQAQLDELNRQREYRQQHPRPEPPTLPPRPQWNPAPLAGLFGQPGSGATGNQWLEAAQVLGAIGSQTSQGQMLITLRAFRGMLEGTMQGNKDRFDQSYSAWKDETARLKDQYREQSEYYDKVLSDNKLSMDEKRREMELHAVEIKDAIGLEQIRQGRIDQLEQRNDKMAEESRKMGDLESKIAKEVEKDRNAQLVTPEARLAALNWLNGMRPATRRSQDMNAIYAALRQIGDERGWTEEQVSAITARATQEFTAGARTLTAFDVGRQGDIVRSLNVGIQHLDVYEQVANALNNRDTLAFNALKNIIQTQFGYPAPTNFEQVKSIVADEVVKGTLGTPGGVKDREAFANNLRASLSPADFAGQIRLVKLLMAGQMLGLRQQYESATQRDDFDTKLLPRTQDALREVQEGGLSAAPAPATEPPPGARRRRYNPTTGQFETVQ